MLIRLWRDYFVHSFSFPLLEMRTFANYNVPSNPHPSYSARTLPYRFRINVEYASTARTCAHARTRASITEITRYTRRRLIHTHTHTRTPVMFFNGYNILWSLAVISPRLNSRDRDPVVKRIYARTEAPEIIRTVPGTYDDSLFYYRARARYNGILLHCYTFHGAGDCFLFPPTPLFVHPCVSIRMRHRRPRGQYFVQHVLPKTRQSLHKI